MPRISSATAVALGLLCARPPVPLSAQALRVPYQTFTLPNGLQVIVHEDHSVPVVAVNTWYGVGSSDGGRGGGGVAGRSAKTEGVGGGNGGGMSALGGGWEGGG